MKKVLIIGHQGYLGSILTHYLQERGYYCVGADIGFFQYGVLYPPKQVPMIDKEARTITAEDIKGFDSQQIKEEKLKIRLINNSINCAAGAFQL